MTYETNGNGCRLNPDGSHVGGNLYCDACAPEIFGQTELTGSPKQIAWAEDIRRQLMSRFDTDAVRGAQRMAHGGRPDGSSMMWSDMAVWFMRQQPEGDDRARMIAAAPEVAKLVAAAREWLLGQAAAKWWIDRRFESDMLGVAIREGKVALSFPKVAAAAAELQEARG